MEINIDPISTIIFDCDGVLVDSEPISCYALNVVFEKYFSVDIGTDYSQVIGKSVIFALNYYANIHDIRLENLEQLIIAKENAYFDLANKKLELFPNTIEFLDILKSKNYRLVVASSGSIRKITFSLNHVGITHYFDGLYSSELVTQGKPSPELLFYILKKYNLKPSECLVIEDSIPGIQSGLNASIPVIGFPSTHEQRTLDELGIPVAKNGYTSLIKLFSDD